jgi:hypothetical protein
MVKLIKIIQTQRQRELRIILNVRALDGRKII